MSWTMLGPASLHPDPNKARGGIPALTPDDVRLALGGLREKPFLFGMAAFLGHRGSLDRIEQLLTWDVMEMAQDKRWGSGKDRNGVHTGELTRDDIRRLERFSSLLLFEVISARSRHDTYAHEQALPTGSATVLCPMCRGKGEVSRMASREQVHQAEEMAEEVQSGHAWPAQRHAARRLLYAVRTHCQSRSCNLCHGRGRFLLTNPKRAAMLGVPLRTWERHWAGRYAEAMNIPREWEAIAIGHVRKRLRPDT